MKRTTETNNTDKFIGRKIKLRRIQLGFSQAEIGKLLKLTYQQFQKYESGTNRVSASRLYKIAKILKVPITYFFDGIEEDFNDVIKNPSFNKDILKMNKFFSKLNNAKMRKAFIDLLKCLTNKDKNEHN